METNIKWISVHDELPKDSAYVLAMGERDDKIYTYQFDPTYGWIAKTDTMSCERSCNKKILFWSNYNLPK
jgi:uncharacterized Fe-S cluster-containing radical SAM superfamily protein